MKERLYLNNYSFNRSYDDQPLLKNHLESEAKIYIQKEILNGTYEFAWSYIMDYKISFNLFSDRKSQIIKWKTLTRVDVSENIVKRANEIMKENIKAKYSLCIACAIESEFKYFITTDRKALNKLIDDIIIEVLWECQD
jgi:hypothetical protein